MNLAQLRTAMDRRTGRACDVPAANAYINEAINTIASCREWPWLESSHTITITDETEYDLPSNYSETQAVIVNGWEARRIYIADGDTFYTSGDECNNGSDWLYSVVGTSTIQFYPQPPEGISVVHRYYRTEPLLAQDLSSPVMPERYHTLIADLASGLFLERVSATRSAEYLSRYERGQRKMYEAVERSTAPQRIRIRPESPF